MWEKLTKIGGLTNIVMMPKEGKVYVSPPEGTEIYAFVNGARMPLENLHVNAGDMAHFELKASSGVPAVIPITYNGVAYNLEVWPEMSLVDAAKTSAEYEMQESVPSPDGTVTKLKKLTEKDKEIMTPAETINLFANPNQGSGTGGAMGAGLGAGLLGGVLGGALLGNNGGLLGRNNEIAAVAGVTPAFLSSELNRVQDNQNFAIAATERLTQSRFDAEAQREIQAAVERTAAATQLANAVQSAALGIEIAKGQGEVNTQVALTSGATQTQAALNAAALGVQVQKASGELATQAATQAAALGVQVQKTAGEIQVQNALTSSQNQIAIKELATANSLAFKDVQIQALTTSNLLQTQAAQNKYELTTTVKNDGDQTRALINKLNDDTLNRLLVTAQNEIIELRGDRNHNNRSREVEVSVNQTVNQNQAQLQAQQQQQQQLILNERIINALNNLQIATATNQSLIIGNTGAVVGGAQTANPVNVRA